HGTSTMADPIELEAIARVCGGKTETVSISSTKSSTGHLLGAAGAIEAIICTLAIRDQIVPPTINLENPVVGPEFDLVPNAARERSVGLAMSNSFGFGGSNASLVMAAL
ncbi:MAG: beta-ketoacyl-ACP synthase II, partial [Rhodobacteraceae bacterium]|nr:beta-ketoacyl-ACP synthase II [Paracoccaceae bacterium]